ncbi:MAG: hypothetical protein HZC10_01005 [Nitrospirae bacterium]|nr:hypothetical protein [Nitrospirota bacterium]
MINRREFMMIAAGGVLSAMTMDKEVFASENKKTKVSLIKTSDRQSGVKRAIDLLNINPVKDKKVLLFN